MILAAAALAAALVTAPLRRPLTPQPARPARQEIKQYVTPVRVVTWGEIKRRWS